MQISLVWGVGKDMQFGHQLPNGNSYDDWAQHLGRIGHLGFFFLFDAETNNRMTQFALFLALEIRSHKHLLRYHIS